MTTQDLMNLPYAGMAEKQLRKDGMWRLTPLEKIESAIGKLENGLCDAQEVVTEIEHEMENLK